MFKTRLNQHRSISDFSIVVFVLLIFSQEWTLASDDPQKPGDRATAVDDRQNPKSDDANGGLTNDRATADNPTSDDDPSNKRNARLAGMMNLLRNRSVLKELGIDEGTEDYAEVLKLTTVSTEFGTRLRSPTDKDRAERLTVIQLRFKIESEQFTKLKERLKPAQFARWQQIWLQRTGLTAIDDTDVASQLGITNEQQAKLAAATADLANRNKALRAELSDLIRTGKDIGEIKSKLQQSAEERSAKYREVLTADQLEKFDQMKGEPFTLVVPERTVPAERPRMSQFRAVSQVTPLTILAANFSLQHELGIKSRTPAADEIVQLSDAYQRELDEVQQTAGGNFLEAIEKLQDKYVIELKKLLTPQQFTRLQQINWQRRGVSVLNDRDVRILLEITDEQQKQIDDSWNEMLKDMATLRPRPNERIVGEPIDPDSVAQRQALQVKHEKRVDQILSARQKEKFDELKGKPFDTTKLYIR